MNKQIGFHHGALCDDYEKQANEQGYTLGKYAETAKKLGFGLVINHVHGILTDSMYDKALQKLQKEIVKHLKIKEGEIK